MVATLLLSPPTVAFAAPAAPAARLLPELGRVMGVRLVADRLAGRQVLLIHVKAMPPSRLYALIGSPQMRKLWARETAARERWIARAIAEPKSSWLRGNHKIAAVAALVGAPALAALRPGTRAVWSLPHRRGDFPLPSGAVRVAEAIASERLRSMDGFERRGNALPASARTAYETPADSVFFAARRGTDSRDVAMDFATYDAKGMRLLSDENNRILAPTPNADPTLVSLMPSTRVAFSPPTLRGAGVMAQNVDPDLATFTHPETNEPLALAVGPALDETAALLNTHVVACLPDRAYRTEFGGKIAEGLSRSWPAALAGSGMLARVSEGTLVVSPADPASSVVGRADRLLLRRRIADVARDGTLNYRYSEPEGLERSILETLPVDLYHDLTSSEWPWGAPLAWNSLTDAERSRALGDGLSLTGAREFLTEIFQGTGSSLTFGEDEYLVSATIPDALSRGVLRAALEERPTFLTYPKGAIFPDAREKGETVRVPATMRTVTLRIDAPGGLAYTPPPFTLTYRQGG